MKILSPTSEIPSVIFGTISDFDSRNGSFFAASNYNFEAIPKVASQGDRVFEGSCEFGNFWQLAIFEAHAPSSQFDRLVHSQIPTSQGPLFAIALDGQGFHGQHQNTWETGVGNLYFSASLPFDDLALDLDCAKVATLLACVATREAIAEQLKFDQRFDAISAEALTPKCKWINDIVCGDEKIAGCLASIQIEGRRIRRLNLGIGINIAHKPTPDSGYNMPPCCFADFDGQNAHDPLRYAALLSSLCRAIEKWSKRWPIDQGRLIRQAYTEQSAYIGREVILTADLPPFDTLTRGILEQIDEDLSLWLRGDPQKYTNVRMGIPK